MIRYVAFLRAINVGGRNAVPMAELTRLLESLRYGAVRTYIQSGNVLFDAAASRVDVETAIAAALRKRFGFDIGVMVREAADLRAMAARHPFAAANGADAADVKWFVAFLQRQPAVRCTPPLISPKGDVEVIAVRGLDAFCLSRKVNGQAGFPNAFVERAFGVPATTRAWTTVEKLAQLAAAAEPPARARR